MNDPKHDAAWHGTRGAGYDWLPDMLTAAGLLATAEALGNALDDARHDGYADALDAIREGATETRLRAALAEHDAQVLRDAADAMGGPMVASPAMARFRIWLRARADRIAGT